MTPALKDCFLALPKDIFLCYGQQQAGYGLTGQGLSVNTGIVCDKTSGCAFVPGARIVAQPWATTAGLNIASGTLPTTPVAGDIALDNSFNFYWYGSNGAQIASWMPLGTVLTSGLPAVGMGGSQIGTGSVSGTGSFVLLNAPTGGDLILTALSNVDSGVSFANALTSYTIAQQVAYSAGHYLGGALAYKIKPSGDSSEENPG
jgi:hypothetical protein